MPLFVKSTMVVLIMLVFGIAEYIVDNGKESREPSGPG